MNEQEISNLMDNVYDVITGHPTENGFAALLAIITEIVIQQPEEQRQILLGAISSNFDPSRIENYVEQVKNARRSH